MMNMAKGKQQTFKKIDVHSIRPCSQKVNQVNNTSAVIYHAFNNIHAQVCSRFLTRPLEMSCNACFHGLSNPMIPRLHRFTFVLYHNTLPTQAT